MRWLLSAFATMRGRLVLLVCLSTFPAILVTFFAAEGERRAALARSEADARHLAGLAVREHVHQIHGAENLLRALGETLSREDDAAFAASEARLLPILLSGYPQFANVGVLDPEGRLVHSAHPTAEATSLAGYAAFRRALDSDRVEVGGYVIGPIVRRPVLHVAYAVRAPGGAVRRVLFVALDLRWLADLARQVDLPAGRTLLILDRDGGVLASSAGPGGDAPPQGTRIEGLAGVASRPDAVVLPAGARGERRFFVGAPMEGLPGVAAAVGLPYARLTADAERAFVRTLALLALVTAVTVGFALLAAEVSVLRVLRSLSHAARRFGAGDLAARSPVPRGGGELRELCVAFNAMADALEARQREAAVAAARLRGLAHGLEVAREAESARIARELHDEVGQVLTSLKLELAGLRRQVARAAPGAAADPAFSASVERANGRLDDAVEFVRRIASELRPAVLDRLGLAAALEWQAGEAEAGTGVPVLLEVRGLEGPLDDLAATAVFRIVQEALTNVARHAGARNVRVTVVGDAEGVSVAVEDDGRGIDPAEADRVGSIGIHGMRERAALAGGTFSIRGAPGEGTRVEARIPRSGAREGVDAHPAG